MATFYPVEADINTTIASAGPTDIVYLPSGTITTPVVIANDCEVQGQQETVIDVRGQSANIGVSIDAPSANVSNFRVLNETTSGFTGVSITQAGSVLSIESNAEIGFDIQNANDIEFEELRSSGSGTGFQIRDSRNLNFQDCEAVGCSIGFNLEGSSSVLGDTDTDPSSTGGVVAESDRTDRVHHIHFSSCVAHENNTGIRLVNANHIEFNENSKTFDNTNIGIQQNISSYSNLFRGEVYGNAKYGARNNDKEGNLHTLDMRSVWWGDITGPSSAGPGEGDKISNYISFEPWLRTGTEPDLPYPVTRDWIWSMLGDPLVRVELTEEQVTQDIEVAIDKYMYYWDPQPYYHYFYHPPGSTEYMLPLDIPKERVLEVVYQPHEDIYAQLSGSESSFFLTYYMQNSGGTFLTDFYVSMAYKETFERTLGLMPTWEITTHPQDNTQPYDPVNNPYRDFLRLYPRTDSDSIKVGIKVSRVLTEEEVDNSFWIRKYALTWAKEQLARVRGKFQSVPGPTGEIGLNADVLVSEAQQERESLIRSLIGRGEPLGFTTG